MIHNFLRSIGFHNLQKNTELFDILEDIVRNPDRKSVTRDIYGNGFGSFSREYGENFGITVCGDFLENNEFHIEYYFPFFRGSDISTYEQIEVERFAQKEAYAGICDDLRLGATLIFYIDNLADLLNARLLYGNQFNASNAVLSGLASSGKILLPVLKTEQQVKQRTEISKKRMDLLNEAKSGSQEAIDSLTLNDMDTYSMLSQRVNHNKEDILSIVESSFIPYGIESDQYVVIGEILSCRRTHNQTTNESVWILGLDCNDLVFDIIINERDLYGEPAVGRRFRGRILMQGFINFS